MKNPARKYIDLIRESSSKWANWDPPNQIKVGDYGTVNRKSGEFEREGNIYVESIFNEVTKNHPPEDVAPDDTFVITSLGVKTSSFNAAVYSQVPGLAMASFKGKWEFGKKRGALLVMAKPSSSRIPSQVLLKHLVDFPELKGKVLVTQAYYCHAYTLYLSGQDNDAISLALVGSGPVTGEVNAAVDIGMSWWNQHSGGLFRDACDQEGKLRYTPLYTAKKIRTRGLLRRDNTIIPPEGDDLWINFEPPWDPLDDDGEEEHYEDTVFDV